jgi:hypothetical protein
MRLRLPSPALAIAVAALFIALSGTAVAAGIVPLAKRALSADNAKKLGGQTAAQISSAAAARPGPASSIAGLATVRTAPVSVAAESMAPATVSCAAGEKASGGGFSMGSGAPLLVSSAPTADGSGWSVLVFNILDSAGGGTAYAVCVK